MGLYLTWDYYVDQLTTWMMRVGMPVAQAYHALTGNVVMNAASCDAQGLEKVADTILAPSHYLLAGRYFETTDGIHYTYRLRFNYQDPYLWAKTGVSSLLMPISLTVGGALKALSFLQEDVREHQKKIATSFSQTDEGVPSEIYNRFNIQLVSIDQADPIEPPRFQRRPGDEQVMHLDKVALKEILTLFHKDQIPYWLDCGTLLGAQRYGGIIPWDFDLDMAILQVDFDRAFKALSALDHTQYVVQDWSSRDRPKSYLKVYVKKTGSLIDIYNFEIDEKKQVIRSVLSNENSIFLPESWKIRERRFIIDTPISYVFPLKKAQFDGIVAFVPAQTVLYLQQRYGQNIEPAKVFNELSHRYEKDLTHPYWQMPHAH
jgi:phosphorylcholine metabolism protein LicD